MEEESGEADRDKSLSRGTPPQNSGMDAQAVSAASGPPKSSS
jgi:hypothetical protein